MKFLTAFLFLIVVCSAPQVNAQTANPSIVLIYEGIGEDTDRGFIEMAKTGAEKARRELKIDYQEYTIAAKEKRSDVFERFAKKGANLIIALGFQNVSAVLAIADEYPNTKFTVIDGMIPPLFSNVQSVVFRDNEGAFLVGVIAAMHSRTQKIGFIGGMDVPIIRDFAYGYTQGAQHINPDIIVYRDMIGKTKDAWNKPEKAAELAEQQIDQGVDIIFAAAGGSGMGMLEKVATFPDVYSIGVDTNQNATFPGSVLTSLVKRVDKAVFQAISQVSDRSWQPGIKYMGIKEGALDYAVDVHNKNTLRKDAIDEAERTKDLILQGIIKVDNYRPQ